MHLEVEQKFRVVDPPTLQAKLRTLGVDPLVKTPVVQRDEYFAHPARDFAETDEALRIRRVGTTNCLTYKGPKLDTTTKTRRELELPLLSGEESATQWQEMLLALGFRTVLEVRKERRAESFMWQGHEVEIAWDEVAGLGTFVELELSADEQTLAAAKSSLASLVTELGLTSSERRSYLELLLFKDDE